MNHNWGMDSLKETLISVRVNHSYQGFVSLYSIRGRSLFRGGGLLFAYKPKDRDKARMDRNFDQASKQ
jgi:hypothetical protein